jgi:hypothetical protein
MPKKFYEIDSRAAFTTAKSFITLTSGENNSLNIFTGTLPWPTRTGKLVTLFGAAKLSILTFSIITLCQMAVYYAECPYARLIDSKMVL